jgi:hypothetical protein
MDMFSIPGHESEQETVNAKSEDRQRVLAVYLSVWNFALSRAIMYLNNMLVPKKNISGETLRIAQTNALNVELVTSPYVSSKSRVHRHKISQGELLTGYVNWDLVMENKLESDEEILFLQKGLSDEVKKSKVLFKVSHLMNQPVYIPLEQSFNALQTLHLLPEEDKTEAQSIFDVLLALYKPSDFCLITVLTNLPDDAYVASTKTHQNQCVPTLENLFAGCP